MILIASGRPTSGFLPQQHCISHPSVRAAVNEIDNVRCFATARNESIVNLGET